MTTILLPEPDLYIPGSPKLAANVQGTGPLILFLHGIGGNRTNWQAQLPAFADAYTAVALDVRGYGNSDDWTGPLVYEDLGHDLARVLNHFQARQAHIVGLSMGGRIAMQFAKLYPERVGSLTLVDTHLSFSSLPADQRRAFVEGRSKPLREGKTLKDIAAPVARNLLGPNATAAMFDQLVASIEALHVDSYLKFLEATVEQDSIGDLGFITAPAHFVVGEHDTLTPPDLTRTMARQVSSRQVETTVIPNAGHLSNIENPQRFNQEVRRFIDSLPASPN